MSEYFYSKGGGAAPASVRRPHVWAAWSVDGDLNIKVGDKPTTINKEDAERLARFILTDPPDVEERQWSAESSSTMATVEEAMKRSRPFTKEEELALDESGLFKKTTRAEG